MAVPTKVIKITKVLNKISTVGAIVLLVMLITAISLFVYFRIQENKINANIEDLKVRISTLEKSEQQLVLTKDRLARIATIKLLPSVREDLTNFQEVTNLLANVSDSSLLEASIQSNKTDFSVTSKDSNALATFLEPISKLKKYKTMILAALGFSQTSGFTSDFTVEK